MLVVHRVAVQQRLKKMKCNIIRISFSHLRRLVKTSLSVLTQIFSTVIDITRQSRFSLAIPSNRFEYNACRLNSTHTRFSTKYSDSHPTFSPVSIFFISAHWNGSINIISTCFKSYQLSEFIKLAYHWLKKTIFLTHTRSLKCIGTNSIIFIH